MDLYTLLRPTRVSDLRFRLQVPDGLQQGRGAWGGVATGAMASAAQQVDPRFAVRNLSAQLVAPLQVGSCEILVAELRRGSGTTTLDVRVIDGQAALIAHAAVVLGAPRAADALPDGVTLAAPAEVAAGPDAVPVVPIGPPLAPDFLQHLLLRPVAGLPFTGANPVTGWVQPRDPLSDVDASVVIALADAWWVAVMAQLAQPRPVATLGFSVDLPTDPVSLPRLPDGRLQPLFHRGRTIAVREGFTLELRELWTADGRLAAFNTQTVAVIR